MGQVGAVYTEIGSIDIFGAADTGVVGNLQCIISHKQVIVAGGGIVHDFRTFRALPAISHLTGSNQ